MDAESNVRENLSEKIYHDIRLRLIVGELSPNDTLSIRTLAEEYELSAMPVREALKRLEFEKVLSGSAKRAYWVPAITPEAASDLFFVRATLEGAAAELAMDHLKARELKQLRSLSRAMDKAWQKDDVQGFLLYNFRFHSMIYRSSGNLDLSELAETLYARSGPSLGMAIRGLADKDDWANSHDDIIEALAAGDRARVRRLIEADVNWGTAFFRRM